MSRRIFTWLALVMIGLCTIPASAAKHYITRTATGQYYAYDPMVGYWAPIADPQVYLDSFSHEKRPEGFGGVISYKNWVKDPTPVQTATGVAAASVNAAANVAERVPAVKRVIRPARNIFMKTFKPAPKL